MPAKKRAQRAADHLLRPGSEHFEIFFENAPIMMTVLDREWRHVKVNRRWLEVLRYEPRDVIGKHVSAVLTDASFERLHVVDVLEFWRHGYVEGMSYDAIAKDGKVVSLVADAEALVDTEGNLLILATARPRAKVRQSRNREMMAVVEHMEAIALSLRLIARTQEEQTEISSEQLRELVLSARAIERTVADLTDAVVSSFNRLTPPTAGG